MTNHEEAVQLSVQYLTILLERCKKRGLDLHGTDAYIHGYISSELISLMTFHSNVREDMKRSIDIMQKTNDKEFG